MIDLHRAGWSISQTAWRLGVSVREYREIEAGSGADVGDVRPDQQDLAARRSPATDLAAVRVPARELS
jgi:hypothetical protein